MVVLNNPVELLDRIDWDFPRTGTDAHSIHSFHWFPGNFIPQIPSAFIQALSNPGDLVLDAFAGSGTTVVEAIRLGRRAILSDRVKACVMIGGAKVDAVRAPVDRQWLSTIMDSLTWEYLCRTDSIGLRGEGSHPELALWYAPGTLAQLRFLWQLIERCPQSQRQTLSLIFSDVLFSCASPGKAQTAKGNVRRHHWGWVADNVRPRSLIEHNAIRAFASRLGLLTDFLPDALESPALVVQQDARWLGIRSESVDLVVTSPPYISVIDYTRANRLLYLWMNWPFDEDRRDEIGARFKRGRLRAAEEYVTEMRACWLELVRVMRPGAYCAVVIGESRRYPGSASATISDLQGLMPLIWGPVNRNPSRRRVSDRRASEALEQLYVLRKS